MFKRDKPHTILHHARELFWPSMGWGRAVRYAVLRIIRLSDTTHSIAGGLASGAAIAFTPILGTHFIQVAILAWIFRFNLLAGITATFLCNPWTLPFMWWGSIEIGSRIFEIFGVHASRTLPQHMDLKMLWDLLMDDPVRLVLPWLTGGYLLGFLVFPIAYIVSYYAVDFAKAARARAKSLKIHEEAMKVTERNP